MLPNLKRINLGANKVTEFIEGIFVKFVRTFDVKRQLIIDFKM